MAYSTVAQLQSRRERVPEYFLEQFGFEVYLPRHGVRQCPGVFRPVRIGSDEHVHVPDEMIDALRKRERNGAIDLPTKYGRRGQDRRPGADHFRPVRRSFQALHPGVAPADRRARLRCDEVELI